MLRLKEKRRFRCICSCWMKSRCQRHIYDMTRGRRGTQLLLMFFHSSDHLNYFSFDIPSHVLGVLYPRKHLVTGKFYGST